MVKHETRKQARFTSQLTLLNIPSKKQKSLNHRNYIKWTPVI